MFNTKLTILFACIVLLISSILLFKYCNKKSTDKQITNTVNSLNDTLTKKNDTTSSISVITTSSIKEFTELHIKDSIIQDLQKLVNQYKNKLEAGSSVTSTKIETKINTVHKTKIIDLGHEDFVSDSLAAVNDTIVKFLRVYPTYEDSIKNEWIDYSTIINKDSAIMKLKVNNSYSTIVGVNKGKPFVDIINHNPYSTVTSIRSYQVTLPKPKKWGIGGSVGVTYYSNKAQPYIGVGLNYDFIKF